MGVGAVCQSAAVALVTLGCVAWVYAAFDLVRGLKRLKRLDEVEPLPAERLPTLTIIAASKDERERVEAGARSLLAQDYPGFRLLVVDDRSTDGTGEILDRLAAEDPRLEVEHVTSLPDGWIGKCHALARASARARTEWLLFTDGDVVLAPDAARRAVSLALREGADHIAIAPDLVVESLGEAAFVGYFVTMFHVSQRPWKVDDPRSKASVGVGAFNLVRREAYERAGGHERLRYELLDDLGLGKILKRSGGKQLFVEHRGKVRARWHAGVHGLIRGVEKNAFAAFGYRAFVAVAAVALQIVIWISPLAGLFLPGLWPRAAAAAAWVCVFVIYATLSRHVAIRTWQAIFMPLGGALISYAILRSTLLALTAGGITWRETFYRLEELRRRALR